MLALKPRIRAFSLLVVILSFTRLQAQDSAIPSRLTLEEAIRLAVARNPSLAAVRNEVETLEGIQWPRASG